MENKELKDGLQKLLDKFNAEHPEHALTMDQVEEGLGNPENISALIKKVALRKAAAVIFCKEMEITTKELSQWMEWPDEKIRKLLTFSLENVAMILEFHQKLEALETRIEDGINGGLGDEGLAYIKQDMTKRGYVLPEGIDQDAVIKEVGASLHNLWIEEKNTADEGNKEEATESAS